MFPTVQKSFSTCCIPQKDVFHTCVLKPDKAGIVFIKPMSDHSLVIHWYLVDVIYLMLNIDTNSWNFLISTSTGQNCKGWLNQILMLKLNWQKPSSLGPLFIWQSFFFNRPSFPSGSLHSTTSTMGSATSSYATYSRFFFRRFACGLWSEQEKSPRPAERNAKPHRSWSQPWSACYLPPPHLFSHPPHSVTTLKKTHTGCGLKNKN